MWWDDESCRIGAFLQPENYPKGKELGKDMPRCGFYIRPEDIDSHLQRLDKHKIPHTGPVKTADNGDDGTAICFADPDGNQYEFWAPANMPQGAMEVRHHGKCRAHQSLRVRFPRPGAHCGLF